MVALNYQARFARLVELGLKRQTIRARRNNPPAPGCRLQHFTGQRTKQCRKLRPDDVCKFVSSIRMREEAGAFVVHINGVRLTVQEIIQLARDDGFGCCYDFYEFFRKAQGMPFEGDLITW